MRLYYLMFLLCYFSICKGLAQLKIETEGNLIASVPYSSVRIPASGGTNFDLSKDLQRETSFTFRLRVSYRIGKKHELSVLYAPLSINYAGSFNKTVLFSNSSFEAGEPVNAVYKFNSYRLTYRYRFINTEKWIVALGLTGKVRDANISLKSNSHFADYPDLGFVPLINFYASWQFVEKAKIILEGDALGTNKGRAEDIFAGASFLLLKNIEGKAGYRVLEGGANVEKVYNFILVNYAVLGINFIF